MSPQPNPHDAFDNPQPLGVRQPKPPWSPRAIAIIAFLFSFLPGGIMLALNYERLGKPQYKLPAILITVVGFALFMVVVFVTPEDNRVVNQLFGLFHGGVAIFMLRAQKDMFDAHIKGGGQKASPWPVVGLTVASIVLIFVVVFVYMYIDVSADEERFTQGVAHLDAQEYAQAEPIFRTYSAEYPEEAAPYWNLAVIYENTGRLDEALAEINSFLRLEPDAQDALEFRQRLEARIALGRGDGPDMDDVEVLGAP